MSPLKNYPSLDKLWAALRSPAGRQCLIDSLAMWAGMLIATWLLLSGGLLTVFGLILAVIVWRYVIKARYPLGVGILTLLIVGNILPTAILYWLWRIAVDDGFGVATAMGALLMTFLVVPMEMYFNVGYALRDEPDTMRDPPR